MKAFIVFAALVAAVSGAPAAQINVGPASGPVHTAFGPLVGTNRGFRDINLEGFSEDDNQDGFVDPIGQAVVAPVAPLTYGYGYPHGLAYGLPAVLPAAAPVVAKKVEAVKPVAPVVAAAPAVVSYAHHPLTYAYAAPAVAVQHHTYTVPVSTHTETIHLGYQTGPTHVLPHGVLGGFPLLAAAAPAAPAAEAEAATVVEA